MIQRKNTFVIINDFYKQIETCSYTIYCFIAIQHNDVHKNIGVSFIFLIRNFSLQISVRLILLIFYIQKIKHSIKISTTFSSQNIHNVHKKNFVIMNEMLNEFFCCCLSCIVASTSHLRLVKFFPFNDLNENVVKFTAVICVTIK